MKSNRKSNRGNRSTLAYLNTRKLRFEFLEARRLLAGDLELVRDLNTIPVGFGGDKVFVAGESEIFFTFNSELWHFDTILEETTKLADGLSDARFLGSAGGTSFFAEGSFSSGFDLWRSDGSSSGTMLIAENFDPTIVNSQPLGIALGNQLIFGTGSGAVWSSDGTPEGSYQVGQGGYPVKFGEKAVFLGRDSEHGTEPWISDGTLAGTTLLKDINPGTGSSGFGTDFVEFNGDLYFKAFSEGSGTEIWKTDGTTTGTVLAVETLLGPGDGFPLNFVVAGDFLYFTADAGSFGDRELWRTDGTQDGTSVVIDANPEGSSEPSPRAEVNGMLVFTAFNGSSNELWITDGDTSNTFLLTDISPEVGEVWVVGDEVVFENYTADAEGLWKVDLFSRTPTKLTDTFPFVSLVALEDQIVFLADSPEAGLEPWVSDLTPAGTGLLADLLPGPESSISDPFRALHVVGDRIYFSATYSETQSAIFSTDGSESGTVIASQIYVSTSDSGIEIKGTIGDKLVFSANQVEETGRPNDSLWILENNEVTKLHGNDNYFYGPLAEWNGDWYFTAFRSEQGRSYRELYKTDGTTAGTTLVLDLADVGINGFSLQMYPIQSGLVLYARTPQHGYEFWTSDGTMAGTRLIADIAPGTSGINLWSVMPSTEAEEYLYFMADDRSNGVEVWRTDGSELGTSMLADIATSNVPVDALSLRRVGDKVLFNAHDGSDTTPWGMYSWDEQDLTLSRIFSSDARLSSHDALDEKLRFYADGQLWETDGTEAGTQLLLSDLVLQNFYTSLANQIFFGRFDSTTATRQLWVTDGTNEGTLKLGDFSSINFGIEYEGRLYFSADDRIHGEELWSTDGTPAGTRLETDAFVGETGSVPRNFVLAGGEMYVTADSEKYGRELFKFDTSPLIVTNFQDYPTDEPAIDGSLRRMLEKAAAREGIDDVAFEPNLAGTVFLAEQLEIREGNDVRILGPGNQSVAISGGGETRVFYVEAASLGLNNLRVVEGFSTDFPKVPEEINGIPVAPPAPGVFSSGGGILNIGGSLEIDYVSFEHNETGGILNAENPLGRNYVGLGGAIANFFGAELNVSNSRFANNLAIGSGISAGGAIEIDAFSRASITNTSFTRNRAETLLGGVETIIDPNDPQSFQGAAVGGAVKASGGSELSITHSYFLNNSVVAGDGVAGIGPRGGFAAGGGAVGSQALSLLVGVLMDYPTETQILNSRFIANQAQGGDGIGGSAGGPGLGGAVVNWGASELLLSRSYFAANTARGGNGGNGGSSNPDGGDGGMAAGGAVDTGFSSFGTPITVISSTVFIGNRAVGGAGGIGFEAGLAGLGGNGQGGALANTADLLFERLGLDPLATGDLTMQFSIVRNNRASGGVGRLGGDGFGGGVFNQATTNIRFTPISGNVATGGSGTESDGKGIGGGIYSDEALMAVVDLDFISSRLLRRNRASTDGQNGYGFG